MHKDIMREVRRFDSKCHSDFFELHSAPNGGGWCNCVAWWVPTWEAWRDRRAEENQALRESLCSRGEYDGYLLYVNNEPVGWCQVGPRDRLEKLRNQFGLKPDPKSWAITCFFIAKSHRCRGLASHLLSEVLLDLQERGVKRVEAFPKRGAGLGTLDLWNGPEAIFLKGGFKVWRDDPKRPVLVKEF
ncbi:GNAT family N-acetyltransferase [Candidatus Acetothermia bacterium]|nr:GNAT family N-acetyltransferase [Candidatus Acetothermia bacterium]MBI3642949.1 GNAT family N-acetyltransferase [Candidatus Acetothermia bacterium]